MALAWKYMAGESVNNEDNYAGSSWAAETVNVRTGGQAYRGILTGSGTTRILESQAGIGSSTNQTLTDDLTGAIWSLRFNDVTPAKDIRLLTVIHSGGASGPVGLRFKTNGDFALLDGNATPGEIATAPSGFAVDTYYPLRFLFEIIGGDTRVRLYKWTGRQWVLLINHTVAGIAPSTVRYDFHASTAAGDNAATNVYLDDIGVFAFTADDDLPTTPIKVARLTPNALGTFGDFTGGTGTSPAFEDVDDANADEEITTDASTASAGTQNQTYNLPAFTTPAGVKDIEAVCVFATAMAPSVGPPTRNILVFEQGASNVSPSGPIANDAFAANSWFLPTPPAGGVWTDAILASAEIGLRKSGVAITVLTLSQVFMDVLYLEPFLSERWHLRGVGRGILRGVR